MKRLWLKAMKWLMLIGVPCFVVSLPVTIVINWLFPAQFAVSRIESRYPHQVHVCIGQSSEHRITRDQRHSVKSGTYILIPRVFKHPSAVSVTQVNDNGTVSIQVNESQGVLIFFAIVFILAVLFSCKYSYPRGRDLIVRRFARLSRNPASNSRPE